MPGRIGLDQAGIDRKAFSADQALIGAAAQEQRTREAAALLERKRHAETIAVILRERFGIPNPSDDA